MIGISRRLALSMTALGLILTAACSTGEADKGASGGSGDTVVVALGTDGGQNYDPQQSANIYAFSYMLPVFDSLLTQTDGKLAPGLATKWDVNPAGDSITLTLRDGVKFHDGTPFDASAVKASLERGKTLETSTVVQFLKPIKAVQVKDEKTVVLTTTPGTSAAVLGSFTDRAGMIVSPAAAKREDFTLRPVGTGPYAVSAKSVPGKDMIYERFDGYWDVPSQTLKSYTIRLVSDAATEAVVQGEDVNVSMADTLPKQTVDRIVSAGRWDANTVDVQSLFMFYLSKKGVFADERLRQAVSYAVDRTKVGSGFGVECVPDSQSVMPSSPFYDKSLPTVGRDLDKARDLLRAAGVPDGFSFKSTVFAGAPSYTNALQVLQQQLAEVGIKMSIEPLPPTQLVGALSSGKVQAYFSNFPGADDPNQWATTLTTIYSPGPADPKLTDLAGLGAGKLDAAARVQIFKDWQRHYQETAWHVGLCNAKTDVLTLGLSGMKWRLPTALDPRGLKVDAK